jgi:hypothetical protein
MTDNGLAALAAALHRAFTEKPYEYADGHVAPVLRDDAAAAILGERGVFLPEGDCGHEEEYLGYWRATNEALATIATLRAALDGLVAAAEEVVASAESYSSEDRWGIYPLGLFAETAALRAALATAKETP